MKETARAHTLSKLENFLLSDWEKQGELLRDPDVAAAAKIWLGDAAFSELKQFSDPGKAHLGSGPRNILFAPGVMGSTLQSAGLGGVWWLDMMFARDKLELLELSADGEHDKDPKADIQPATIDVLYVPFRRAIASSDSFGGSEHFPYDWRKPLVNSADALRKRILQCAAETGKPVHLVGHSMGGLVIRCTLMLHGKELWPKIGKVVFVGTPHYGSPSIAGYLKNHLWGFEALAVMGMFLSREAFRSMRGVLSLLPAPVGIYPGTRQGAKDHPCANFDLYDAQAWKLDLDTSQTVQLQVSLDAASQFHRELQAWHEVLLQEYKDRMLMIVGVGEEGLFRLEFSSHFWGAWEHTKKVCGRIPGDVNREGDGRVPLASAELEDVTLRYVKGSHGGLPNVSAVAADVAGVARRQAAQAAQNGQGCIGTAFVGRRWHQPCTSARRQRQDLPLPQLARLRIADPGIQGQHREESRCRAYAGGQQGAIALN